MRSHVLRLGVAGFVFGQLPACGGGDDNTGATGFTTATETSADDGASEGGTTTSGGESGDNDSGTADTTSGDTGDSGDTTTSGDGDGDGDGDAAGDGDGDGDGDAAGDGDGDGDGDAAGDGDGDGDGDAAGDGDGDGDGDAAGDGDGDGDGDAGPECTSNTDCQGNPAGSICDTGAGGVCIPCTNDTECDGNPGGPLCNTGTGICEPCSDNTDCVGNPNGEVCDAGSGFCVPCTTTDDTCPLGQYCVANSCIPGCQDTSDCPGDQLCNTATNTCEGCLVDADCAPGTVCDTAVCVPGCSGTQPCPASETCCGSFCADTQNDPDTCGGCDPGDACPDYPNAGRLCVTGACQMGACDPGFNDCDGDPLTGCEVNGACTCTPGATESCWTWPGPETPDSSATDQCEAGMRTCNAQGTAWGPCLGEVWPSEEICDGIDNDCDGTVADENADQDNDGYALCDANGVVDCCDVAGAACGSPDIVNPGAFEVTGDTVDNDCDGNVDEVEALCDSGLAPGSPNNNNAINYLKAIELCPETTSGATGVDKIWGVITNDSGNFHGPRFRLADGTGSPNAEQHSVRPNFGSTAEMDNRAGFNMSILSTGNAAAEGQSNPGFVAWQSSNDKGNNSNSVYSDWIGAQPGGNPPSAPSCGVTSSVNPVFNPVALEFQVRAPTNANSFEVDLYLLSSEYPEWVCDSFNDFVVVLIDQPNGSAVPSATANPADENLAIFDPPPAGGGTFPVGVNLTQAGLFTDCNEQNIRDCAVDFSGGSVGMNPTTCVDGRIEGSGYENVETTTYSCGFACSVDCYGQNIPVNGRTGDVGGGTGWLTLAGNVDPGEIFRIRVAIWDSGDEFYDSNIMLDNWRWKTTASTPGVTPG